MVSRQEPTERELTLDRAGTVRATVQAACLLAAEATPADSEPATNRVEPRNLHESVGTRDVTVEAVLNGRPVASQRLTADGSLRDLTFEIPIRAEQLDRSPYPRLGSYQSDLRPCGRPADPRVEEKRRVVLEKCRSVLVAEVAAYQSAGTPRRATGVQTLLGIAIGRSSRKATSTESRLSAGPPPFPRRAPR